MGLFIESVFLTYEYFAYQITKLPLEICFEKNYILML